MYFASDNAGPAHPKIAEAVLRANEAYAMPYGVEAAMDRVRERLGDLLGMPGAAIYLVGTGTAANALLLATLTKPWQAIFCSDVAHITEDECGAPEFFSNGAKLVPVGAPDALMDPEALRDRIDATAHGVVHGVQRGPVSITSVTERGTIYARDHMAALVDTAKGFGLPVHLDGARFANAVVGLECRAADLVAGVDAVSFGGTKNGCLGVEAAVIRDPDLAWEFELRRKRAGHLFSKHRFLSAQMEAYLEGDLWLELATAANAAANRLARGLGQIDGVRLLHPPQANIVYAEFAASSHRRAREAGARFYSMGQTECADDAPVAARLVCDWSTTGENTDRFLELLGG